MEEAKVLRSVPDGPRFIRRNDKGIRGSDLVRALKFKSRRPVENECEHQLAPMRLEMDVRSSKGTDRSHLGNAASCRFNRGFLRLPAIERCPVSLRSGMMKEALTGKRPPSIPAVGKFEAMFRESRVNSRRSDLDNLKASRTLQHLMPDLWRLKDEIAFIHDERLALVLVDHPHPAAPDIDHLKLDSMIMHPVRYGSALRNENVRSDVTPPEPARDQVPVEHSCTALGGRRSGEGQHELRRKWRQEIRRWKRLGTASYANAITVPAKRSGMRLVRRIDEIQAKALAA